MKTKKEYERFFWSAYFVSLGLITWAIYEKDLLVKIVLNIMTIIILLLVTGHFWAKSDYRH